MLHVLQNIIKTLHGASFAQGKFFLAQASRKAMHTCIRTYTYMYTYVYAYVYTYAFEVKNRIPCMSLLTTRLLAAVWLKLACSSRLSRIMEPAVPDMWHCYVQLSFGCDQSRQNVAFFLRQNRASSAQAPRKLCARQPVFDSKGISASNHSCIK